MRAVVLAALLGLVACGRPPEGGTPNASAGTATDTANRATAAPDTPAAEAAAVRGPKAVLQAYYDAIADKDYATAYALWEHGQADGGQTLADFAAGYRDTELTSVEIGTPARPDGAAGSVYVTIPVVVEDLKSDGTGQHYEGTYTLRRSNLTPSEGGNPRWRLYRGDLKATPEPH